jgi:hypothetical protein
MGLSPIKRVEYSDGSLMKYLEGAVAKPWSVAAITAKRFRIEPSSDTQNSKGTGYDVSKGVSRRDIART